jgi:hypothetical protein
MDNEEQRALLESVKHSIDNSKRLCRELNEKFLQTEGVTCASNMSDLPQAKPILADSHLAGNKP